ncbi:MAG: universal stress protein [Euryarchaeota archaeon]|nr:universal stress protein [Euryarchaeota archaeon]
MFQKILYPTDFSDCSELALKYITKLKTAGTEEIIVMHVLDIREITTIATGVIWFGKSETDYQHETEMIMKKKLRANLKKFHLSSKTKGSGLVQKSLQASPLLRSLHLPGPETSL